MQRIVAEPEAVEQLLQEIKESPMGEVRVPVRVVNPFDPSRTWEGDFLVDAGSTENWMPADVLNELGLDAENIVRVWLADGTSSLQRAGFAYFTLAGVTRPHEVIFAPEGSEPLLGLTQLESMGFLVDPRGNQLLPRSVLTSGRLNGAVHGANGEDGIDD